jgi:DNA-binding transcriptional ArsR family regulator
MAACISAPRGGGAGIEEGRFGNEATAMSGNAAPTAPDTGIPALNGGAAAGGKAVQVQDANLDLLRERAAEAARLLRLLANEKRLLVMCHLVGAGEMNVGDLADTIGLSQSALSQHLAKLREDGLVATRREAQTIWYRLADAKAARLLEVLRDLYCRPPPGM